MDKKPPRVAAIVVNYNGKEVTLQAVASLRQMTYPAFDLIVLDNASTDGSPEALTKAHPDLEQLQLDVNRGSSSGYAAGFRWAFENSYDYVLLLNNDIEVEPDLLDRLVEVAESDPRIGVVGPKCYFHGDRRRLWSAGGKLRFRESITHERGYGEIDRGQYDQDAEVDYINGCAILIKRAAAEAAGPWDPIFFICVDDADFCTRAMRKGFRCVYAHRAILYHMIAYTTGGYTPDRNYQFGRSSALYVRRYGKPWNWFTYLAFSAAAFLVAWLRELRRGNQAAAVAKLKGLREGLKTDLRPKEVLPARPVSP
ncbi:MAG TPA: glycosyltransferase family 2 protein [Thermoanaerobaculia bacterium]|nr:glycosyltransferase family 2 protein [Thermoanaerobaculia bacterium]